MKNILGSISTLTICASLLICSASAAPSARQSDAISYDWRGQFEFEGEEGRTVGGSTIMSSVRMNIDKDGSCHVVHTGYQVYEDVACRYEILENSATLKAIDTPHETSTYPSYNNGDVLVILKRDAERRIHARWGAMQPHGNHAGETDRVRRISKSP